MRSLMGWSSFTVQLDIVSLSLPRNRSKIDSSIGCWIQARYSIQRTTTDFGLMWITIICNIVVYGLLFLYFKGYITTDGCRVKLSRVRDSASFYRLMPLRQVYGLLLWEISLFSSPPL